MTAMEPIEAADGGYPDNADDYKRVQVVLTMSATDARTFIEDWRLDRTAPVLTGGRMEHDVTVIAVDFVEPLSTYDLRLRSLDLEPGDPIYLCSECDEPAQWSAWLHTPEWGPQGGLTRVLCLIHALAIVRLTAQESA